MDNSTGFSTLNTGNDAIPSVPVQATTPDPNALGLINPDDILSGTQRGSQALGAPNIQTDSANERIVVNDGNNLRVIFGRTGTGPNDWGLEVSKPGFNVDTATDSQLIFNSSQDVFKIVKEGSTSITVPSVSSSTFFSVTVPHNLGFAPIPQAFVNFGGYFPMPYFEGVSANGIYVGYNMLISCFVDTTNFYVNANVGQSGGNPSASGTFPINYYLLQETASTS